MKPLSRQWTEAEIARLRELAAKGATVLRASAALSRSSSSVTKMARTLGLELAGVRAAKAINRQKIAAAEKLLRPGSRRNDGSFA